ncbi:MAG: class I SAM-dependent methyltransferase [Burkholderiales bacterium]|nr:MAG: class I SAM-dependent methyltransferase [Burkholderiales bacterium]
MNTLPSSAPLHQTEPVVTRRALLRAAAAAPVLALPALSRAQQSGGSTPFTPQVGQQGKDVIWVPTPDALVDRMLRMAQVTPNDFVVDLGAGDGKIVIAAARDFKCRALGVEFNPDMVGVARRNAEKAGVANLAKFEQGDIFAFDYSAATVVTMYLLPGLNLKLRPTLLKMKPGTRLVTHQFTMGSWEPDDSSTVDGRPGYLWIVPASVGGSWKLSMNDARGSSETNASFSQVFQNVTGTVRMSAMEGRMRAVKLSGDRLVFDLMDDRGVLRSYDGRVSGDRIEGTTRGLDGATGTFAAQRTGAATPVDAGRD